MMDVLGTLDTQGGVGELERRGRLMDKLEALQVLALQERGSGRWEPGDLAIQFEATKIAKDLQRCQL